MLSGGGNGEENGLASGEALITLPGLRTACRRFDVRLSETELQLILDAAADGGREAVSFRDFAHIMRKTAWF